MCGAAVEMDIDHGLVGTAEEAEGGDKPGAEGGTNQGAAWKHTLRVSVTGRVNFLRPHGL